MPRPLPPAGADLQARNKDGLLPLHSAVLGSHAATVSALLAKGADPLALGPNCYPSFAQWKLRRGLQAMQVGSCAGCSTGGSQASRQARRHKQRRGVGSAGKHAWP